MLCALTVILFFPPAWSYRLIYDLPFRHAAELPDDMPPEEEEPGFGSLPGFLSDYESCIQPPLECPNENITFWFYTRETQDNPHQLNMVHPESLKNLRPVQGKPWKLIIHGYTGWRDYAPNPEIRPGKFSSKLQKYSGFDPKQAYSETCLTAFKIPYFLVDAYFKHGEYNIISIDYGPIALSPCYWSAATNVPLIANCTAQVIDELILNNFLKIQDLHVVAFSLGGQVAGHLHLFLKAGQLTRISALDPAFPLFMSANKDSKLDASDASFVDVIHTNAAWKGQLQTCGHVDFYPNGGYSQPGCTPSEYGSVASCNHARAVVYFAESISSDVGFWASPCGSYVTYYWGWCSANETDQILMGEYVPTSARGSYYLTTKDSSPFAMGKEPINSTTQDS